MYKQHRWNYIATLAHTRAHWARAILESIAFLLRDQLEALHGLGADFAEIRSLGGAAKSPLWLQIKADVLRRPITTVACTEATALGAAMVATVGAGLYPNLQQAIDNMVHVTGRYEPIPENVEKYNELYKIFTDTYEALKEKTFPGIAKFQGF